MPSPQLPFLIYSHRWGGDSNLLPFVISGQLHLGEIYPKKEQAGVLLASLSPEIQEHCCWQMSCATKAKPDWAVWKKLMSLQSSCVSWSFRRHLLCSQMRQWMIDRTASPPAESNRNPFIWGLKLYQQPKYINSDFRENVAMACWSR